jgi:SPP1 family predicted phage head-tail adaptor
MRSGSLDRLVTFRRRKTVASKAGNERGAWEDALTDFANYRRASGGEVLSAGGAVDLETGVLTIRDSEDARQITASYRVTIEGRDFAITSVALPYKRAIQMTVSSRLAG